jgi:hypothetical protein
VELQIILILVVNLKEVRVILQVSEEFHPLVVEAEVEVEVHQFLLVLVALVALVVVAEVEVLVE